MLIEYGYLGIFFIISLVISMVVVMLSMLLVMRVTDIEKVSAYECGFHPFQDTRSKFDVRFYLVAILFIIFDLEIIYLFPWGLSLGKIGELGYYSMWIFVVMLLIGFYYEWKKGALDWE